MMISLKSARELDCMRRAGRIVAEVLDVVGREAAPGVTTLELDRIAEDLVRRRGGRPVFKGYPHSRLGKRLPFPGTICASINDEVVHGVPSGTRLRAGDILSVDVGVDVDKYKADAAVTVPVGKVSGVARRLVDVCRESLARAVDAARSGATLDDVSRAVQEYVEGEGFSVVRDYTGHGIGRELHEEPKIPNFVEPGSPGASIILRPGMTLAIEPMVNQGGYATKESANKWTVITADGKLSAHFEHTVAVTDGEPLILTAP